MKRAVEIAFRIVFLALVIGLSISLIMDKSKEKKIYQELVSLDSMEYGQEFLEEAKKIPGLLEMMPVLEIPVLLKLDEYVMEGSFWGVEVEALHGRIRGFGQVSIGNTPVLFLEKNALSSMTDQNGHVMSQNQQERYLESYESIEMQYTLQNSERERWLPCIIGGILDKPEDNIWIPFTQARDLKENGKLDVFVTKCLVTVRGKSNFMRAMEYLQGGLRSASAW